MFTEKNKGFTIITNFGCDLDCQYCISRQHPLLLGRITRSEDVDWGYVEECISKRTISPKVNLSGGGDPFYRYWENGIFYDNIYNICQRQGKLLDAHTRIIPEDARLLRRFNKLALTLEHGDRTGFRRLGESLPKALGLVRIRVIDVVDENMTSEDCENYIRKLKTFGIKEITFRQMFGNGEAAQNYRTLKQAVPPEEGILFLDDGEYHDYYFTTTNTLLPFFFGNTKEDREIWRRKYETLSQKCV